MHKDDNDWVNDVWRGKLKELDREDDNDWVNDVWRGKLKELDREDARKRPGGIVLRMTWKV